MLFLPGEVVLDKTDLELEILKNQPMASQKIFIVVQIVSHVLKWGRSPVPHGWAICAALDMCMQRHSSLKHNKTDEFTVNFVFQFYLNLR